MAITLGSPRFQAFDDNGDPLSGGLLYSYSAGTSTAKDTYSNAAGTAANSNPVVLNSRGEANVWLNGTYKLVLKDSAGNTIWTMDNVGMGGGDVSSYAALRAAGTPTATTLMNVLGHTTAGDGGGGQFIWTDSGGPYTDNGGTIIVPTGGDGSAAWLREYSGAVDLRWFGAVSGADCTTAITNFGSLLSGGNVDAVIPQGTWNTTTALEITGSNVRLVVRGTLAYTGADPSPVIYAHGDTGAYISNVQIVGEGGKVDGGAAGITWTYSTGTSYHGVALDYVTDPYCAGLEVANALVNGVAAKRCVRPKIERCVAHDSLHDNGISITQDPDGFNDSDASTWCNGRIIDCITYGNKDFGQTIFNATGCRVIGGMSYDNGTDDAVGSVFTGGGYSSESITATRMGTRFEHCVARDNRTNGFMQTGNEAMFVACDSDGVTSNSAEVFHGHGLAVFAYGAAASARVIGGRFVNSAVNGINARNNSTNYVELSVEGHVVVEGNGDSGIEVAGFAKAVIGPDVEVGSNCSAAGGSEVLLTNSSANTSSGVGIVHALFLSPAQRCAEIRDAAYAEISGCRAYQPCAANTNPPFYINGATATAVAIAKNNTIAASINPPANVVQIGGTVTRSIVGGNSGDSTANTRATTTATTKTGDSAAVSDAAGWADATAQTNFNTLLDRLRKGGVLCE